MEKPGKKRLSSMNLCEIDVKMFEISTKKRYGTVSGHFPPAKMKRLPATIREVPTST